MNLETFVARALLSSAICLGAITSGCSKKEPARGGIGSVSSTPASGTTPPATTSVSNSSNSRAASGTTTLGRAQSEPSKSPGLPGKWNVYELSSGPIDASKEVTTETLTAESDHYTIRVPAGKRQHLIVFSDELSEDFAVDISLRWPNWETDSGGPSIKFGILTKTNGRRDYAMNYLNWANKRSEFARLRFRCSAAAFEGQVNDDRPRIKSHNIKSPRFFMLDVRAPAQFEITKFELKLESQDLKVAKRSSSKSGPPPGMMMGPGMMPPGMMGAPGMSGPSGMTGPNGMGGPNGMSGMGGSPIPQPTNFTPVHEYQEWYVAIANRGSSIANDLRVNKSGEATTIAKSFSSGEFWIFRDLPEEDGTADIVIELPSMMELQMRGGPSMLGLGLFPDRNSNPVLIPSPSPQMNDKFRFDAKIIKDGEKATWQLNRGSTRNLKIDPKKKMRFGLWLAGAIQCQVLSFKWTPKPQPKPTTPKPEPQSTRPSKNGQSNSQIASAQVLPNTRVWSDSSGKYQTKATFLKLENEEVVLKNEKGKVVRVPLKRLAKLDQDIAKKLSLQTTEQ